ncbi:glycoside hydrolase family 27 protein [Brachybacterium phenoliresistens]|uniref:glycoside hydrolase family 27 protein n=1 Tax=Brachybacterium phenoliresistens TaxID=396014 RepID=UPI0031D78F81
MTPSPLRPTVTAPPRGWNSWDCFGGSVREDEVIANAEHMARHLLPQGWDTIVVDIQWYEPEPGSTDYAEVSAALVDEVGRPLPAPGRFPSAADGAGFAPLAERIHALGLRFGVHLMRGIPRRAVELDTPILGTDATARDLADPDNRCPWNPDFEGVHADHPAAQAWYDSVFALLAQWGVDYVKVDDVLYPPIQRADIAMMRTAIDRSGRPMLLSLSPGKELSAVHAPFLAASADAWRVSDDLWDTWDDLREQFQRAARWAAVDHEGGFADLDMLPLGRIGIRAHVGEDRISRLTAAEQRTMLTLWNLGRSPLMMGGHLPDTPAETLEILTREEILAIGDTGVGAREIVRDRDLVVWRVRVGEREVRAIFWLGERAEQRRIHAEDLDVPVGAAGHELWTGAEVTPQNGWYDLALEPHGCVVLSLA